MAEGFSLVDLGKLAEPINTLITKIANAAGILYEPTRIRRKARAEADAELITATNQLKLNDLSRRALKRFIIEESIKQTNIENILDKTFPEISESADPSKLSNEWLLFFFERAKCASDNELQTIWAKILAGETNNHGSFSKSTLRILSEMSQEDATTFMKVASFAFKIDDSDHIFLYEFDDEIVKKFGLSFGSVNRLNALGLLSCGATFGYMVSELPQNTSAFYNNKEVRISFKFPKENKIQCGQAILTQSGRELLKICSPNYSDEIFNYVYSNWKNFSNIENIDIIGEN